MTDKESTQVFVSMMDSYSKDPLRARFVMITEFACLQLSDLGYKELAESIRETAVGLYREEDAS